MMLGFLFSTQCTTLCFLQTLVFYAKYNNFVVNAVEDAAASAAIINVPFPLPSHRLGFPYLDNTVVVSLSPNPNVIRNPKVVTIDMFVDLLCPDSKAAAAVMYSVMEMNNNTLEIDLIFHQFPLPYHRNAFPVAQAATTVTSCLGPQVFKKWMDTIYQNQELFWNDETKDKSQIDITMMLRTLALETFPRLSHVCFDDGMSGHGGTEMDHQTRIAWKYATSRSVTGTPIFFVNDVSVSLSSDTTQQWMELLQPLIDSNQKPSFPSFSLDTFVSEALQQQQRPVFKLSEFDSNEQHCQTNDRTLRACEFKRFQSMCCTKSEFCINYKGCVIIDSISSLA